MKHCWHISDAAANYGRMFTPVTVSSASESVCCQCGEKRQRTRVDGHGPHCPSSQLRTYMDESGECSPSPAPEKEKRNDS